MAKKIFDIEGIKLGSSSSNTRYGRREDSLVITIPSEAKLSGKFTSNKLRAAPVTEAIQNRFWATDANQKGYQKRLWGH